MISGNSLLVELHPQMLFSSQGGVTFRILGSAFWLSYTLEALPSQGGVTFRILGSAFWLSSTPRSSSHLRVEQPFDIWDQPSGCVPPPEALLISGWNSLLISGNSLLVELHPQKPFSSQGGVTFRYLGQCLEAVSTLTGSTSIRVESFCMNSVTA